MSHRKDTACIHLQDDAYMVSGLLVSTTRVPNDSYPRQIIVKSIRVQRKKLHEETFTRSFDLHHVVIENTYNGYILLSHPSKKDIFYNSIAKSIENNLITSQFCLH